MKLKSVIRTLTPDELSILREKHPEEFSKILDSSIYSQDYKSNKSQYFEDDSKKYNSSFLTSGNLEHNNDFNNSILEILMSTKSIDNKFTYDFRASEIFKCRRDLFVYDILAYRGVREGSLEFLKKIQSRLVKVECYEILIEVADRQIKYLGFYGNKSDIKSVRSKKEKYLMLSKALERTIELYFHNISTQIPYNAVLDLEKYYLEIFNEITEIQAWANSRLIEYYYYLILFMYHDTKKDYNRCESILKAIEKILRRNKFIFSKARMHQTCLNGSYCLTKQYFFNKAINYVEESKSFTNSIVNKLIGDNLSIIAKLQKGDKISRLIDEIEDAMLVIDHKTPDFIAVQTISLSAHAHFISKNYKTSVKIIENGLRLVKDKEGWNHYLFLLKIVNLISMDLFDSADFEIEKFRKRIERRKNLTFNYDRLVLLKRIFVVLSKKSYRFELCSNSIQRLLHQIWSNPELHWAPGNSELIPIDMWIHSKISKSDFNYLNGISRYKSFYESLHSR
jgi:hypothetical protein